jgi:hypothetical protein
MTDLKKVAEEFSEYMTKRFDCEVIPKEGAPEMDAVALGFDLARFFGATGVADGDDFKSRFSTTIGSRIYMPKSHREDPLRFIEILTHECQHVLQFQESGVKFAWLYLAKPEARVKYEADAYAAGLAVERWLLGDLDVATLDWIVGSLVSSYHLRASDADLAAKMLKSHFVSIKNGVVMSKAGREAISWLDKNYPELKGKA